MSSPIIRPAVPADAMQMSELMTQLGHPAEPETLISRMAHMEKTSSDRIFVAEQDNFLLGLIGIHTAPQFHRLGCVGRITVLVVREEARGQGIGKALVHYAMSLFREAGCTTVEVTSNKRRADAHAFYRSLDFEEPSLYFRRTLDSGH